MKTEKTTQTIEFTVEKSETFVIRRHREIVSRWCSDCECEERMSEPEAAARIAGISVRKIYAKIEAGNFHFAESAEGVLLVCLRSLGETLRPTDAHL